MIGGIYDARLRDESLIVNELTKRCDALTRELRCTDVSPLSATANNALRSSREAARTLVVSPDDVADPAPRARGAFSELPGLERGTAAPGAG